MLRHPLAFVRRSEVREIDHLVVERLKLINLILDDLHACVVPFSLELVVQRGVLVSVLINVSELG